ncbi:MAG TPA: hypothetical protein VNJ70_16225 [Thermoanaerobaculia bacterium]|nr:hypothetical protein [Thermoanaerobaculia bacterium]
MTRKLPTALVLTSLVTSLVTFLAPAPAVLAQGHEHDHTHADPAASLGNVRFPTSCRPEVAADFERAVAHLHSFGYEAARIAFAAVAERDPACAMAQWGIGMSWYHPIWAPPTPQELAAGRAAAEKAAALGAPTPREQGYVAAIGAFYKDADRLDHRTRARAYLAAVEELARRQPDDHEAAIFHALALLGTAPPSDATYAQQKQAAAILERILPLAPEHPGVAHYIIHSFDYPELALLALPAARSYAKIAPASAHALHMPSHIFVRLGLWQEAIDSNLASAAAADRWVAERHPGAAAFDTLHALDYLAYGYLQTCQDDKAKEVLARTAAARTFDDPGFAVGYAVAAVPARWTLERRRWAEAAALAAPLPSLPWDRYSYALALHHFARALGAARSGDAAAARTALGEIERLHAGLRQAPPAGPYDWAGQVEALRLAAAGWLARAERKDEEAVRLLTAAADLEDRVGKHPVSPGAVLPARELLADLLLEQGKGAAALAEYDAVLRSAPGRFNALYGAARAAELAGDGPAARQRYEALVALCGEGDREELRRAREVLAAR